MLLFNFGYYEFWELYDPINEFFGNQKVVFDGVNKLILIAEGETNINVKVDIYSNWKEWVEVRNNAKYEQALTALGGDPITATAFVGTTYFLENGWRIQPYSTTTGYVLTVAGNLFTREEGGAPANPVSGVSVNLVRSNLVDAIVGEAEFSGNTTVSISSNSVSDIANNVWEEIVDTNKGQNARDKMRKMSTKSQDIALE